MYLMTWGTMEYRQTMGYNYEWIMGYNYDLMQGGVLI